MENMEVVASQRQSAESYHNDDQLTDEVHLNYDRPNTDRDNGGCKDADVCDAKTGSSPNAAMGAAHNDNDGCELDMETKNEVFGKNNLEHLTGTSVSSSETFKQHGEDSLNENTDIPQSLTDLCTVASTRESLSASTSTTTAADTSPEQLMTSASGEQNVCSLRKSTRCRKRSLPAEPHSICPNCGLSLKLSDLENHLQIEINKLEKLTKHRRSYDSVKKQKASATSCSAPTEIMDCHTRYKQYLSVRTRRERRNKAKKQVKQPGDEEATCPVCNDRIIGTPDELTEHVDLCLQQQEANSDGELDVEGEDHFEEYTWAGQTRIRASSMLDGGLAGSGFAVAKQNCEDEDMELDIDGDVCSMFGNAQYTEADLIPCNDGEDGEEKERQALRKAVLRAEGYRSPGKPPPDRQRWQQNNDICKEKPGVSDCDTDRETSSSQSEVIESLKAKLKDQEAQLQKIERPKCLICMDWYTKPLTSIQCWHVHCEECWLRTLGTKKLCPQCNTITSASDLRRIYL